MNRRGFVATTGSVVITGLAGCLGGSDDDVDVDADVDTPEATIESWLRITENLQELGPEGVEERILYLLHSNSPIRSTFENLGDLSDQEQFDEGSDVEILSIDITRTDEDISARDIEDRHPFVAAAMDDTALEEVAQRNVSAVAEEERIKDGEEETRETQFFLAWEDEGWRILI